MTPSRTTGVTQTGQTPRHPCWPNQIWLKDYPRPHCRRLNPILWFAIRRKVDTSLPTLTSSRLMLQVSSCPTFPHRMSCTSTITKSAYSSWLTVKLTISLSHFSLPQRLCCLRTRKSRTTRSTCVLKLPLVPSVLMSHMKTKPNVKCSGTSSFVKLCQSRSIATN